MRVKYLVGAVGFAVVAGLIVPGVSDASRGGGTPDPIVQPNTEVSVDEAPVDEAPVDDPAPTSPAVEESPEPADEGAPPVAADPGPVTKKPAPAAEEAPEVVDVPTAPAVDDAPADDDPPVVTVEPTDAPAPAPAADKSKARGKPEKADKQRGPCHMDSYEPRQVDSLDNGEEARAEKVDRNDNGTVCRKVVPGRGNTGEGSNIKDDHMR